MMSICCCCNDTATTEIYTLSLHDALPIFARNAHPAALALGEASRGPGRHGGGVAALPEVVEEERREDRGDGDAEDRPGRSEEHTSELQSRQYLVCRLLLETKK